MTQEETKQKVVWIKRSVSSSMIDSAVCAGVLLLRSKMLRRWVTKRPKDTRGWKCLMAAAPQNDKLTNSQFYPFSKRLGSNQRDFLVSIIVNASITEQINISSNFEAFALKHFLPQHRNAIVLFPSLCRVLEWFLKQCPKARINYIQYCSKETVKKCRNMLIFGWLRIRINKKLPC